MLTDTKYPFRLTKTANSEALSVCKIFFKLIWEVVVTVKEIFGNIWPKRAAKGQALIITKPFAPKGALQWRKVYTQFEERPEKREGAAAMPQKKTQRRKQKRTLVITASPSFDLLFSFSSCLIEAQRLGCCSDLCVHGKGQCGVLRN
jgi:hypothetical protein